ncbi:MAG: hypothetical protein ACBR12_09745 [Microcoleus sp.]|uniref:hypothetical protein n=1 Tax=Microcoleus sp. TaxID=44472 RepID=UPI003523A397
MKQLPSFPRQQLTARGTLTNGCGLSPNKTARVFYQNLNLPLPDLASVLRQFY